MLNYYGSAGKLKQTETRRWWWQRCDDVAHFKQRVIHGKDAHTKVWHNLPLKHFVNEKRKITFMKGSGLVSGSISQNWDHTSHNSYNVVPFFLTREYNWGEKCKRMILFIALSFLSPSDTAKMTWKTSKSSLYSGKPIHLSVPYTV